MKLSVFAVLLAAKPFDEACKYLALSLIHIYTSVMAVVHMNS